MKIIFETMHSLRQNTTIALCILCVIAAAVTIYLIYDYATRREQIDDAAFQAAQSQARASAEQIDTAFGELMILAGAIADELSSGELAYTDIEARMHNVTIDRPDIDGIAITFEPFVYNSDLRLFQTYVYQQEDGSFETLTGATYDYTRRSDGTADTSWYVDTIDEGAQWHEPFFATGARKILVEYGVPFYMAGTESQPVPAGIVSIDYTLEDVHNLIDDLQLGATGYGFVLSNQGTFLAHPVAEYVVNANIFEVDGLDEAVATATQQALNGEQGFVSTRDPVTDAPTWYFLEPIGNTGWAVGIVLNQAQFQPDAPQTVREQMTIALALTCTIFLILATIFHVDRYRFTSFWAISTTFTTLSISLIVLTWMLTNRLQAQEGITITNPSELERYIQSIERPPGVVGRPLTIPTGVLIQAIAFPDPTSVTINGYIWQRYPVDSDVTRGFALPQRIGEEATIKEVQRDIIDGQETITWRIGITLRQTFDSTRFPFDHRNIMVRIIPADRQANLLLMPDLSAYELLNPHLLPGVDSQASINNWILEHSEYSYAAPHDLTNFGYVNQVNVGTIHELRFSIQAQRVYLGPFIAYLLPGMIAAIMTFAYLLSGRRVGDNDEIVGVLNYAAGLFFVVAVIHTALRDQIAAIGITYMEHLYILLYVAIIAVAANIFVVARFPDWTIVHYRDNLIPKVLYWPLFTGIMLFVTLVIFVY